MSEIKSDIIELRIANEKTTLTDRLTDRLSDWFSPILVKETRQALKSRQFFWTFFLLLAAIAVWTMIGLTFNNQSRGISNAGPTLLTGYWAILGFPLGIVIPFGAYRSLAREFEDGTIQLVSVTTMKAWQIVAGKLGSSMLQMVIYVSVLAPCVAFTYLLRGLGIPQIAVGMSVCISGCFALSCIALFMAGATKSRIFGVAMSIVLIVIQFLIYIFWIAFAGALAFSEIVFFAQAEGFFLTAGLISVLVSTGLLLFAAATSLISFDADNRSTIVRVMMLVQQTLFIAWSVSLMCFAMFPEQPVVFAFVTAHYWMIMGFILAGEKPELSARVRRSIPTTFFGKSFLSFLFPGPGRGLIFCVANIWFCGATFFLLYYFGFNWFPEPAVRNANLGTPTRSFFVGNDFQNTATGVISVCIYSSFFISFVYLLCAVLRRGRAKVNGGVSFASGLLVVLFATGGSLLYHYNFREIGWRDEWTMDQIFNWYWTSIEITDSGFNAIPKVLALFVATAMGAVVVISLIFASQELLVGKTLTPTLVELDREKEKKIDAPPKGETIDEIFGELKEPADS